MPFRGSIGGFGYGRWPNQPATGLAQWATYINSSGYDRINEIVCDSSCNIYVGGYSIFPNANGIRPFNVSEYSQTQSDYIIPRRATSNTVGFLVKYSPNGQCQWVSAIDSGVTSGRSIWNIAIDSQQNIYVLAYGNTNTSNYDASGNTTTLSPYIYTISPTFLYKISPNGITQWTNGFSFSLTANMLTVDISNNVYIGGAYQVNLGTNFNLTDTSGNTQSNSLYQMRRTDLTIRYYIIKYNSDGKVQWSLFVPTILPSSDPLIGAMATDSGANMYCTMNAAFPFTVINASGFSFANSSYTLPAPVGGGTSAILIKYNPNGQAQWATYIDASGGSFDEGRALSIDNQNNIYWVGTYRGTNAILRDASGTTQSNSLISLTQPFSNTATLFLAKYNSNGKAQWATKIDSSGDEYGVRTSLDSFNNIYIAGFYSTATTVLFWDASGTTQTRSQVTLPTSDTSGWSGFLVKYDSNGICKWATYLNSSGSGAEELFVGLAVDRSNYVYVGGSATGNNITVQNVAGITQSDSGFTLSSIGANNTAACIIKYR